MLRVSYSALRRITRIYTTEIAATFLQRVVRLREVTLMSQLLYGLLRLQKLPRVPPIFYLTVELSVVKINGTQIILVYSL